MIAAGARSDAAAVAPGASTIAAAITEARQAAHDAPFFSAHTIGGATVVEGTPRFFRSANARADAEFASWTWNGVTLEIRTGRFGLVPLFVYRAAGRVAVSTSIQRLLDTGLSVHVDERALAVFLRLGFFVGTDTPFEEIKAPGPAATLRWREGRLDEGHGPAFVTGRWSLTRNRAIDRAVELTRQAVDRTRPAGRVAVPLSGGRDSRHIFLELDRRGVHPDHVITQPRYPPASEEDQRVGGLVAAAVGLRRIVLPATEPRAAAEARKNIATHLCAEEHAWFLGMVDHLRGRADTIYEGIGGSMWTVGWVADVESRRAWGAGRLHDVAARMLQRHSTCSERVLENLLPSRAFSGFEAAVDRIAGELPPFRDAADPGKSFHFHHRLRRTLALVPFDLLRSAAEVETPLVDPDLAAFLLSLPPEIVSPTLSRADKTFHTVAIARAFPPFADLPYELDHGQPADAAGHLRRFTRDVARHMLGRSRPFRWMRSSYLVPRLARTLVDNRYAAAGAWLAGAALYLSALEDASMCQ